MIGSGGSRFDTMPTVELHLHLEGAIPIDTLWELIVRHGGDPATPDRGALTARFDYLDFHHFIDTWVWKNRFLDGYEAFEFVAEEVAVDLERQHVRYAEAFFSPTDFSAHGLEPAALALAIRRGLNRVPDVTVALIVDLVRDTGPERAGRTLDSVREVAAEAGVIGIGLGGSEAEFPPEQFAAVYRRAERAGLHRTAHAGEAAGPESVWGAIRALGVERIGHGVRSVEDPALLEYLVAHRIPLEVCPTSNLRTGVVSGWDEHPVRILVDAGATVTVNTDDPAMFGCTLAGEYEELATRFGYGDDVIRTLAATAIDASWASADRTTSLHAELDAWWAAAGAGGQR